MNIRTVIYGTDLSVCCKNAGRYAASLARRFSAELLIVHAFTLSLAAMEVEIDSGFISEQRRDLEFLLARKAERLRGQGWTAKFLLLDGDPRNKLPELADKHEDCLLVLGSHGAGWVERELLGSVAGTVIQSGACPVLTVGPHVKRGLPGFHHVLYFGDSHTAAEWYGIELARQFGAQFEASMGNKARILQLVREIPVDLLVFAGPKSAELSTAHALILQAPCPVLTVLSERHLTSFGKRGK